VRKYGPKMNLLSRCCKQFVDALMETIWEAGGEKKRKLKKVERGSKLFLACTCLSVPACACSVAAA